MSDEIDHEMQFTALPRQWDSAKSIVRDLRVIVRDAGGTSRLTRAGNDFTISFRGPVDVVLGAVKLIAKMQESLKKGRDGLAQSLLDVANDTSHRDRRRAELSKLVADAILSRPPKNEDDKP